MKQKIMFLLYTMNVGGTEKALLNMLETMSPELYEVDLFLLKKKGGYLSDLPKWINLKIVENYDSVHSLIMQPPIEVLKNEFSYGNLVFFFQLFCAYIYYKLSKNITLYLNLVLKTIPDVQIEYDVAIAYAGPFDFISLYILNKVKAKEKIQWIHFDVSKIGFNESFARYNYKRFDKIVVVSNQAAEILGQLVPSVKAKIQIIPNFLPVSSCLKKSDEFNPYSGYKGKYKILTVGRLTLEKGQNIIPSMVTTLIDWGMKNFQWYIVGDGNQLDNIKNEIDKLSLNEYIKLEGLQKNPYPYFKGCDLYVQTSLHEGYCITIAEALLFNKYVISTDVAGAHEHITDDSIGKIVEREVKVMAEAIYKKYIECEKGELNAYEEVTN